MQKQINHSQSQSKDRQRVQNMTHKIQRMEEEEKGGKKKKEREPLGCVCNSTQSELN